MKKVNISEMLITVKGIGHIRNEDVTYFECDEDFCFYGLADGQSQKAFCVEGGKASLIAICDLIKRNGVKSFRTRAYVDEINYEIMHLVRKTLGELALKQEAAIEEFSSTLICIAVDRSAGLFMILHLGDGCILGLSEQGELAMVSAPENGITSKYTWLTTSENAIFHLRIQFGDIKHYSAFYLLSDGAEGLCRGKNITQAGKELFLPKKVGKLQDYFMKDTFSDDATCGILYINAH